MRARWLLPLLAACHGGGPQRTLVTLRDACADGQYWTQGACRPRDAVATQVAAGDQAIKDQDVDRATIAIDAVAKAAPLDYDTNVTLWKQRGIIAAYNEDPASAKRAFEMLLALDPGHFLSYLESPKATKVFEQVRNEQRRVGAPAVDVNWPHGQKVGSAVPIDVEVLADPKAYLRRATLFVRTRGEPTWRAADVALDGAGTERHVVLPPVTATKPVSLELYLRAYDDTGNEVFAWADPKRPREIPLRYDPPRPWWQKWWVITIAGTVAVAGTGAIVYGVTQSPPDRISGTASVK